MFMALRGTELQVTLAPLQQGFTEMFAGEERLALRPGEAEQGA